MEKKAVDKFIKSNSFEHFHVFNNFEKNEIIQTLIELKKDLKKFSDNKKKIILKAIADISSTEEGDKIFKLKDNTIAELKSLDKEDYLEYLYHRYRYEIFPKAKEIDHYPPCLQIEPSSVCNFRCIFCFETDKTFTNKKNGFMGTMDFDNFKNIIDDAQGNIQFLTLASRGEPLVSKSINKMISYTNGKFLNLKLNTNASLFTEEICHTILSDTVKTLVISADAAEKEEYAKIRVNGDLNKIVKNLEMLNSIKEKHYKKSKIITRVSGVNFSKDQNFNYIPEGYDIPSDLDYLHLTTNNTIFGTQYKEIPDTQVPLVADMSSDIFSRKWDYSKFDLFYAGAQKNMGPAGTTLVIVKEELLGRSV